MCYTMQALVRRVKGLGSLAQLGEHLPYKQGVIGSSPITPTNTFFCGNGSVVERRLAKADVASSNLVSRSISSKTRIFGNAKILVFFSL